MNCQDLLKALSDYVDGDIDPAICDEFRDHLAGCNPCRVVVDNIRQTISLYRGGERYEMPPGFHERLHAKLRDQWKTRFGQPRE